jgi:phosphotriesterase-related protein
MKRDPEALARIARATGLNVIMGTAYYVDIAHPKEMEDWTQEQIATEFITEITTGVEGTGIRAGIIGEIGCSWPLTKNELKVLHAAAVAQQKTGAALMIHPGPNDDSILEITDILHNAGADLSRTVIAHVSQRLRDHKNRVRVAELGCYIEYDFFGRDGFYSLAAPWVSDAQCIDEIRKLISEGYEKQILISHDVGWKIQLTRYGGFGYGYILRYVVPWMRREGISEKQIHSMLVENPRKILQFP